MGKQGNTGVTRLYRALGYSWKGFRSAWRSEAAFRQEAILCLVLLPVGWWLENGGIERALLLSSVLLVPLVELLNSAVEAVVDRVGDEPHALSGQAKDMGSAAVLVALVIVAVVWGSVLLG